MSQNQQNNANTRNYLNNFEKLERIEAASVKNVYKIKDKKSGDIYIAYVSDHAIDKYNSEIKINIKCELNIISRLNHPAIIRFILYSPNNFKNKPKPTIITEYTSNGTLQDLIEMERNSQSPANWDNTHKLITLYGISSAMTFLHSHNIIHRNLNPSCIYMDEHLHPKISDFSLSIFQFEGIEKEMDEFRQDINEFVGTPLYTAPEIWFDFKYSEFSDVYAFAMIMYEVVTNEKPFSDLDMLKLTLAIQKGDRPQINDDVLLPYRYLIESCWDQNPQRRYTFSDIQDQLRNDPGFQDFDDFNEEEFYRYVDYIDECFSSFDSNSPRKEITEFVFGDEPKYADFVNFNHSSEIGSPNSCNETEIIDKKKSFELICPDDYFDQLDERKRNLIIEAEKDPIKQSIVGQLILEGNDGFPNNIDIGIKYLEESIEAGCIEACNYYCYLLIKGIFVNRDLDLARSYLEIALKSQDGNVYFLYGKVMKKLQQFDEAIIYFKKAIIQKNNDAMYEYGKMLYKGEGCEKDEDAANVYLDMAKMNGNHKAYEFISKQTKKRKI